MKFTPQKRKEFLCFNKHFEDFSEAARSRSRDITLIDHKFVYFPFTIDGLKSLLIP